jgi:tetratricopeptide (TPR) repeat protein
LSRPTGIDRINMQSRDLVVRVTNRQGEPGDTHNLLARECASQDTPAVFQVPQSVQRLAVEIEGWLDLSCPEHALHKLPELLAVPGARPAGLSLRVRALVELNRFAAAIADLEEIRHFDHDPEWADLTEAWCRKRMDDLPAAVACMQRLLRRCNHSAVGHFNLGCYLALLGEQRRALDEVTIACGIDPSFRKLLANEPDLDALRGNPAFDTLL